MDPITIYPNEKYKTKLNWAILLLWLIAWASWATPLSAVAGYELGGVVVAVVFAVLANAIALVLSLPFVPYYYRSLRYEIFEDEVVVYAGIVTKSVKHVPYRTVTNLKVTRDPFDRILGIGKLAIQTAGMSGTSGQAEESLVGLEDVQAIYDQVAARLRQFRRAMGPTQAGEDQAELAPGDGDQAALLRAMREDLGESQ
jgi:membrane protein YdbS with pleckstrin-like domain